MPDILYERYPAGHYAIFETNRPGRLNALGAAMREDLVAFDPDTVAGFASFEAPHSYPLVIPHVVLNGEMVVQDGAYAAATPGKALRRFDDWHRAQMKVTDVIETGQTITNNWIW